MVDVRDLVAPERVSALATRGRPVPLADLDDLTRGLLPGVLWAVLGTSGAGRTVLACQFAAAAAQAGADTALVLGREPASTAAGNLLCALARVPEHLLSAGRLDPDHQERLAAAAEEIARWPLRVLTPDDDRWEFSASTSVPDLNHYVAGRTPPSRRVADVLVVDDLDLLASPPVPDVVSALRAWGKGTGQAIVVTLPEEPFVLDGILAPGLRRDVDVAVRVSRPDLHDTESPRAGEGDLHVLAHRQGPTSVIAAAFQGHYRRFADLRSPAR